MPFHAISVSNMPKVRPQNSKETDKKDEPYKWVASFLRDCGEQGQKGGRIV